MNPTSPDSSKAPIKAAGRPKVDEGLYFRAYDVISSLDRAENQPLWFKALNSVQRLGDWSQVAIAKLSRPAAAQASPTYTVITPTVVEVSVVPATVRQSGESQNSSWIFVAAVVVISAGLTFAILHYGWHSLAAALGLLKI